MWASNIVLVVLITGTLSIADARTRTESLMQILCAKNGGPRVDESMITSIEDCAKCYESAPEDVLTRFKKGHIPVDEPSTLYCYVVEDRKKCVKSFIDNIKPCLGSTEHLAHNFIASTFEFFCENSKFMIIEAANLDEYERCYLFKEEALEKCTAKAIGHHGPIPNLSESLIILNWLEMFIILSDSQKCSKMQTYQECCIKVLNECEDKTGARILNTLYNYINNDIPCNNLPRTQRLYYY